jgi:hypothetical protein
MPVLTSAGRLAAALGAAGLPAFMAGLTVLVELLGDFLG